jgi:hypothetical protein
MASKTKSVSGHKFIKVMLDYCSDGLWDIHGASVSISSVTKNKKTIQLIRKWQDDFERRQYDAEYKEDELLKSNLEGLLICMHLKAEHPDWTIVFFDDGYFKGRRFKNNDHLLIFSMPKDTNIPYF